MVAPLSRRDFRPSLFPDLTENASPLLQQALRPRPVADAQNTLIGLNLRPPGATMPLADILSAAVNGNPQLAAMNPPTPTGSPEMQAGVRRCKLGEEASHCLHPGQAGAAVRRRPRPGPRRSVLRGDRRSRARRKRRPIPSRQSLRLTQTRRRVTARRSQRSTWRGCSAAALRQALQPLPYLRPFKPKPGGEQLPSPAGPSTRTATRSRITAPPFNVSTTRLNWAGKSAKRDGTRGFRWLRILSPAY